MANKVISIGQTANSGSLQAAQLKKKYQLEVYSDISMVGQPKLTQLFIHNYSKTLHYNGNSENEIIINDDLALEVDVDINKFSTEYNVQNSTSYVMVKSENYSVDKLVNVYAVFNSIHNIFHWIPGERILNPEFGSKLYTLLYNGITPFTIEQIIAEIRHCISRWEPRVNIINIVNVSNTNDTENNTIQLDIIFSIPSLDNNQYKYSYTYNKNSD